MNRNPRKSLILLVPLLIMVSGFLGWQLTRPRPETPEERHYTYGRASFDGIGKFYLGREISNVIGGHGAIRWLERTNRERSEKPAIVIRELALKPDSVVADIGAGSGYFTFRIVPHIPEGRIFAVEIGREMLDYLARKKEELDADNVVVHEGDIRDTRLPARTIDVAFMVDAYHEFSHPREMMESVITALKPGGRVLFVEYRGEDPDIQIKPLHKMTVAQLTREMAAVGLERVRVNYDLPIQHITTFRKP